VGWKTVYVSAAKRYALEIGASPHVSKRVLALKKEIEEGKLPLEVQLCNKMLIVKCHGERCDLSVICISDEC
jgi:hypothetical protein